MAVTVRKKALAILVVVILALAGGTVWVLHWALNKQARAAEFLKEARTLAAEGQYDQAIIQYKAAIANSPENAAALEELGDTYFKQGDTTNAYTYYKSASKKAPSNVEVLSKLARFYHMYGQWEELKKAAATIVSLSPGGATEAQAHHYLAQAYYRDGDWRQAAAEFAKAFELDKTDVDAVLAYALVCREKLQAPKEAELALGQLLARANDAALAAGERAGAALRAAKYYWAAGQTKDAETAIKAAAALAPDDALYRRELGDFYKERGRDAESLALAEKAYLEAVETDPKSAPAQISLGIFYRETGRTDKAVEAFSKAVGLAPGATTYQYLIETLVDRGNLEGAADEIAAMRKIKNAGVTADYLEGRLLVTQSRGTGEEFRKGEELLRKVVKVRPDFAPARYQLGLVLASRGMLDDAAVEFEKTLEIEPNFTFASAALAQTYLGGFQYDKAIAEAKKVLAKDAKDYYANLTIGRALAAQGNVTSAAGFLEQARTVRPAAVEPYVALAEVFSRAGKTAQAVATLEDAAKHCDDATRALVATAQIYQHAGQTEKALETASAASSAKPSDARAAGSYASLLWQSGRAQDALDFLARRAKEYSDSADYQTLLADFQRSMGRRDEALTGYRRAIEISPGDRDALSGMAAVLVSQKKYDEARRSLDALRKADPGSPVADMVEAGILEAEGKADAAAALLENSLRQNPANPEGYYRLALIEKAGGQRDRAIENFKNALKYRAGFLAARLELAQTYYETRFYEDAIREARRAAETREAGAADVARAASIAMGGLVETRRVDEALSQWAQLPPEIQNTGDYMVKLGYLYQIAKDYARAELAFKKAAEMLEEPSAALEGLAQLYASENRYADASAAASQALSGKVTRRQRVRLLQLTASIAVLEGKTDEAVDILGKMQEAAGNDAALLVGAGDAFAQMGRQDKALAAYRAAAQADPASAEAGERIVTMLLGEGKLDEAAGMIDGMLREKPRDFAALVLKARSLLARNTQADAGAAAEVLNRALENAPVGGREPAAARLMLADIYYRTGRMSTAETQLRRALADDPTLVEAKILLAKTLVVNRAYEDALVIANDILKEDPASAQAYAIIGSVRASAGDMDAAAAEYRRSLALGKDGAVLMALVSVLARSGRQDEALDETKKYVAAAPSDIEIARVLAGMYEARQDYASAEAVLRRILTERAEDAPSVYALSRVYKEEGKLTEAEALLKASIAANPTPAAYRYLAAIEMLAGKTGDAEETLRTLVKRYRDYPNGYEDLAALLSTAGRNDEAVTMLREGIEANPDSEEFYEALARFYIARNMQNDAERFLKETSEKRPKFANVVCTLGDLYLSRGATAEALAAYEAAVRYSPDNARAANSLAYMLADAGTDLPRAVKLASFAAGKTPNDANVLDTLGWAYYRDRQFANAMAVLAKARETARPASPTILYHLTLAYSKAGAADRARETARELVGLDASYGERPDVKEIMGKE